MKRLSRRFLCQIFCQIFSHSARRTSKIRKRPPILDQQSFVRMFNSAPDPWQSGDQTVRLLRPLARRALMTLRPFLVLMRVRKPWTSLRWRFLGWKVLFMVVSSVKTRPRWWGLFWSQNGDRLAIQQYIAHYPLLSSIFFAFQQTFFKTGCEKSFNFFTHSPWKTFLPPYLVADLGVGHKPCRRTQVRLFLCIINYIIECRRREIFVVY